MNGPRPGNFLGGREPGFLRSMAEAATAEEDRREAAAKIAVASAQGERFSMVALCGGHALQLAAMTDLHRRIHIMCARQSGKSWTDVGMLVDNALTRPGTTNIFLGLNSVAVRMNIWEPVVCRLFDRFSDLETSWLRGGRMIVRFPNGSRIIFGGYDDFRHIKNLLGGRLAGGVIVLDEAQDAGAMLDELLDVILPPMMTPTTRIVLSGTIPETPAGRFWEESKRESWSAHRWGRLSNVHTPEAREMLDLYLADTGLSEDDPQIQRDWFGRAMFDMTATAYRYSRERNGYGATMPQWLADVYETKADVVRGHALLFCHPMQADKKGGARHGLMASTPPEGVKIFSFAIDPGSTSDRVSIQGWGWGENSREVHHVFDWTTLQGAQLTTGQIFAMAGFARRVFGVYGSVISWRYDAGSSQNTIDNLLTDYGIPVILAAKKTDLVGQVDRNNELLVSKRARIMLGSALEQDYERARWDKNARAAGQYKWASTWHPDPSEAGRYGLQDYFDAFKAPKTETIFDDPLLRAMTGPDRGDDPSIYSDD